MEVVILLVVALAMDFLLAWPLMWLWNAVLPGIFPSIPVISYWQAFGIWVLCSFLFKSTRGSK